jgi:hypothetical protein
MNRINAMKRVLALFAAMSSLAFTGVVAVALAHTVKHPTTVTIHVKKGSAHKPGSFDGSVSSDTSRCEVGRTVAVRMGETTTVLVGTATSDAKGNWDLQLAGSAQPGTYHAVARRKVLRKNSHHVHICKKGISPSLTVK